MKSKILPFGKVINDSTKKFAKIKKQEYLEIGTFAIIDQGKNFICGFTNDEDKINSIDIPAIVFGDHTRGFKYIDFPFAIGADGAKVLIVDSDIADTKYIYYYFKSISLPDAGYSRHFKFLKKTKIPLPENKEDQIRIANLLSQVESLIVKRQESIQLLEELLNSTFLDMFGDPVLNTKNFEPVTVKKFGKIITGNTPPRAENEYYDEKYIEWIKTSNIFSEKMFATTSKEYLSELGLAKGRYLKRGSLLVTCIAGSISSIGTAALVDRPVAFNQQINAIEPNEETNSYYLYWLFKIGKKYFQDQAGKGMKKIITKSTFEKIIFPKPPKPLQDKFAIIVQEVEKTKTIYQESLDELNQLFGALSQQAFKGELDLNNIMLDKKKSIQKDILSLAKEPIATTDKAIDKIRDQYVEVKKNIEIISKYKSKNEIMPKKVEPTLKLEKVSSITEKQILKFLEKEPLSIEGLVKAWHLNAGSSSLHYKELHFELIKEKVFKMLEDKKIEQSFEYTRMLLKVKK